MAKLIADFYSQALPIIAPQKPANGFLMRGIAHQPHIPLFEDRYRLKPAALAVKSRVKKAREPWRKTCPLSCGIRR